jgi:hypothetical protein
MESNITFANRILLESSNDSYFVDIMERVKSNWHNEQYTSQLIFQPIQNKNLETGLVANKVFHEGDIIAFYPTTFVKNNSKSQNDNYSLLRTRLRKYLFQINYKLVGRNPQVLQGVDAVPCISKVVSGTQTNVAMFTNEPTRREKANAKFVSPVFNDKPKVGQSHSWTLVATKTIRKGKEILVCYGGQYNSIRTEVGYTTSCA